MEDIKLLLETQRHLKESQCAEICNAKDLGTELFRLKKISLEDPSLIVELLTKVKRDDVTDVIQARREYSECAEGNNLLCMEWRVGGHF